MSEATITSHFGAMLYIVMIVSLPPLIVAMIVGLVIAILQAATQIQDQTLPLTVKVVAVALTLTLFGPLLAAPLLQQSQRIFEEFPTLTR